jgi:hypothetical protein
MLLTRLGKKAPKKSKEAVTVPYIFRIMIFTPALSTLYTYIYNMFSPQCALITGDSFLQTWDIANNKKNWMKGGGFGAGGANGNMGVQREEGVAKEGEVEEEEHLTEAEPDEEQKIQSIVSKSKAWLRGVGRLSISPSIIP